MTVSLTRAAHADAGAIASLRTAVAEHLTHRYGKGHWSSAVSEKSVLRNLETSRVLVARDGAAVVATLRLATKKPWAIDTTYFSPVRRPLYLLDMAVDPDLQRTGIGHCCLEEAKEIARAWPSDALRLDAYDAAAGAGSFYAKCGFREAGRVTYRKTPLIYFELVL
jgi:GNAT superfamily N-acetyltransferase